jgi:hypothetical protein
VEEVIGGQEQEWESQPWAHLALEESQEEKGPLCEREEYPEVVWVRRRAQVRWMIARMDSPQARFSQEKIVVRDEEEEKEEEHEDV